MHAHATRCKAQLRNSRKCYLPKHQSKTIQLQKNAKFHPWLSHLGSKGPHENDDEERSDQREVTADTGFAIHHLFAENTQVCDHEPREWVCQKRR